MKFLKYLMVAVLIIQNQSILAMNALAKKQNAIQAERPPKSPMAGSLLEQIRSKSAEDLQQGKYANVEEQVQQQTAARKEAIKGDSPLGATKRAMENKSSPTPVKKAKAPLQELEDQVNQAKKTNNAAEMKTLKAKIQDLRETAVDFDEDTEPYDQLLKLINE
jgi:hypothetical protein